MYIYFVRHAQSVLNAKNVHQRDDTPLSEMGIAQAHKVGKRLTTLHADSILSSTYTRAAQTAEVIHQYVKKPITYLDSLCERKRPSIYEGKSFTDPLILPIRDQIFQNFDNPNWHYSDEETYFDIKSRAEHVLTYLQQFFPKDIIVVTHGDFLRIIIGVMLFQERLTPYDYQRFHQQLVMENTGISICEYDKNLWKLRVWNDYTHLEK